MKPHEAIKFVKENLSERAIILQLAEEASELSAAASKLVRILDGENPSPVTPEQARLNLLEEFGDILDCMDLIITPTENLSVVDQRMAKFVRWAGRVKARVDGESHADGDGKRRWANHFERRFDRAE